MNLPADVPVDLTIRTTIPGLNPSLTVEVWKDRELARRAVEEAFGVRFIEAAAIGVWRTYLAPEHPFVTELQGQGYAEVRVNNWLIKTA